MKEITFDLEVLPNFFLFMARDVNAPHGIFKRWYYGPDSRPTQRDIVTVKRMMADRSRRWISFNGIAYDTIILECFFRGYSVGELREVSDKLIVQRVPWWVMRQELELGFDYEYDHVDIIDLCPGTQKLEMYAARLGTKRIQTMPVSKVDPITPDQIPVVIDYCETDLKDTGLIYKEVRNEIKAREGLAEQYEGIDFKSFSDAKCAEKIFRKILLEKYQIDIPFPDGTVKHKTWRFEPNANLQFKNPANVSLFELIKSSPITTGNNGKPQICFNREKLKGIDREEWNNKYLEYLAECRDKNTKPEKIKSLRDFVISKWKKKHSHNLGGKRYTIGMGGVHSVEYRESWHADEDHIVEEIDVASFYPFIMIRNGIFPESIGPVFLEILKELVTRRLKSKGLSKTLPYGSVEQLIHAAINDGGKIIINGTFGKLASLWSRLNCPKSLSQVTLSGQLSLLMLAERLIDRSVTVVSANTDGLVVKYHKSLKGIVREIVKQWEWELGYNMEFTPYSAVYFEGVNSYVAVLDGEHKDCPNYSSKGYGVKLKGMYAEKGLDITPDAPICNHAVVRLILFNIPIEQTIKECKDPAQFMSVRKSTGGGFYMGQPVGDILRWYYSIDSFDPILTKKGHKVPNSEESKPCPILPDTIPKDIHYSRYVNIAYERLSRCGYANRH